MDTTDDEIYHALSNNLPIVDINDGKVANITYQLLLEGKKYIFAIMFFNCY
jgi:hypothetical protein